MAPRQTITRGLTSASSVSSQGRQALTSPTVGLAWIRFFPRGSHLKCFTALVTKTSSRRIPAAARASSSTRPAGPTKGFPARSS